MVPVKLFRKKKNASFKIRVGMKSMQRKLRVALFQLFSILTIHAHLFWYFEDKSYFESWWVTIISATTIGYGDISAATVAGRWTTIICIASIGIWLLAHVVGLIVEFAQERTRLKRIGKWRWKLDKPIVIIGSPKNNADAFFANLISQIRSTAGLSCKDIMIVSTQFPEGLPDSLADQGAVLLKKKPDDKALFEDENVINASIIYIIAKEETNGISNAITYNVLSLLEEKGINTHVIAETTKECDRERFLRLGANAVIRPMRAYPEMVVRAMIDEQNAKFIENMFSCDGDEPVVCPVNFSGKWSEIAVACITQDLGNAVGFVNKDGDLISNPKGSDTVETKGIQILVKDNSEKTVNKIFNQLNALAA